MKRFVWRLQKVLDVKIKEEQIRRTELFRLAEELAAKRGELLMRQRILHDIMTDIKRTSFIQHQMKQPRRKRMRVFCVRTCVLAVSLLQIALRCESLFEITRWLLATGLV